MSHLNFRSATAGQPRPTVTQIIRRCIDAEQSPDAAFAAVRAAYPDLPAQAIYDAMAVVARLVAAEADRRIAEAQDLQRLHRLIDPVFADGRAETVGEALLILAGEGNPEARALVQQLGIGGPNDGEPAPPEA